MGSAGSGRENPNYRHGGCGTRLYRIWAAMKTRCYNKNFWAYKHYGGRGITICKTWMEFKYFQRWALANNYQDDLTLERSKNNQGYKPSNCSWETRKTQANNRRPFKSRSGFTEITYSVQHKKYPWRARYKRKHLGMFATIEEAHKAQLKYIRTKIKPPLKQKSVGPSGFRGVYKAPRTLNRPWEAFYINKKEGIRKYIGAFSTPKAANRARQLYIQGLNK